MERVVEENLLLNKVMNGESLLVDLALNPGFYLTKLKRDFLGENYTGGEMPCYVENGLVSFIGIGMDFSIGECEYFVPLINGEAERKLWQDAVAECMNIPQYHIGAKAVGKFVERLRKTS